MDIEVFIVAFLTVISGGQGQVQKRAICCRQYCIFTQYSTTCPLLWQPSIYTHQRSTTPPTVSVRTPPTRAAQIRVTQAEELTQYTETVAGNASFNLRNITGEEAMRMFPDIFKRPATAQARATLGFVGRVDVGDGDLHCPTVKRIERASSVMNNTRNQQRTIVHFSEDGIFQFINKGVCAHRSKHNCIGSCVQEKSFVYLIALTDDPSLPWLFDSFSVESYCSCKNVGKQFADMNR